MELALAHRVGSAVEQAYARSDLLAKPPDADGPMGRFSVRTRGQGGPAASVSN